MGFFDEIKKVGGAVVGAGVGIATANPALGLATAGALTSAQSAREQRKASKRASRKQRQANRIERARAEVARSIERRRAIAQTRVAQQANIAAGTAQGVAAGSSALQGAQAALGSNLATSLASEARTFASAQQSFNLRQGAATTLNNARADAALLQLGSSLLMQGASFASTLPTSSTPADPTRVGGGSAGLGRFRV